MGGEKGCTRLPEFLDAFVPNGLREVRIQSPVDQEDWRAFARHSDACHFGLYNFQRQAASFPKEFFASGELYGVSLFCYDADHPGQLLPFLGSGVQLLAPPVRDGQAFWDYCFIGIEPSRSRRWIDSNKAFLEQATDYHWAFGWHPDGTISEIWLPTIELVLQNQSALDSVRTLRMDREGIVAFNELLARDVSALATLQSLERLYLDRQQYIDSFGFLAQLGELRQLQIQGKGRTSSDTAGFDECENLETVRFFGAPDPQTIRELATLPKLRRVEIVDENAEFDKPKTRADLRERLPMVNVSFISVDDYEADIGPQLREHLSSTGAEIIRRFERMGATR